MKEIMLSLTIPCTPQLTVEKVLSLASKMHN
ncbi:unnamed protein product [Ectocarpus sp. CCAP 1310/34]|nr:unnamed protein product [Ectocarpus sp. CCAP 1310/34]